MRSMQARASVCFNHQVARIKPEAEEVIRIKAEASNANRIGMVPVPLFAINSGGAKSPFVASDGQTYSIDQFFAGGKHYTNNAAVTGTTDDVLYQTERWGVMSYSFPVAIDSEYRVTIKMAEICHKDPGRRVFDILVQGEQIATAVDLVALVGPNAAYDVVHTFTALDSTLNVDLIPVFQNPKVSAILVEQLTACQASLQRRDS